MAKTMSVREAQGILEIKPPYDKRLLKKAYVKQAKRWHPDAVNARGGSEKEKADAEEKMKLVNQAYATIMVTPEAFAADAAQKAEAAREAEERARAAVEKDARKKAEREAAKAKAEAEKAAEEAKAAHARAEEKEVPEEEAFSFAKAHPEDFEFATWLDDAYATGDWDTFIDKVGKRNAELTKGQRQKPFGKSWAWVDWADIHTPIERIIDPFPEKVYYLTAMAARPFVVEDHKFLHFLNRLMWPSRYYKDDEGRLCHAGYTAVKPQQH